MEYIFYREIQGDIIKQMQDGLPVNCWQQRFLHNRGDYRMTEQPGQWAIGTLLAAGVPTTAAALLSFLLAMVHHPEWQSKIQQEVDQVVGNFRLPHVSDIPRLSTVRAVLKETLRWRPVTAGGIPHMVEKDDTYMGYHIPGGSLTHPNQWAMHRDSKLYPDPEHFRPDRWLDPAFLTCQEPLSTYPNLQGYSAFGFGRRICPGLNLAERTMTIFVAGFAWACQMSKKIDPQTAKRVDVPLYDYTPGLNTQPRPFQCSITTRDQGKLDLLKKAVEIGKQDDALNAIP